jgi:hypothetical protein
MRIEQTLHGYSDGHRLLATSVDLPRHAKYLMLGMSDMSGRNMARGFEEYLTGYPVPDSTLYAFAKTWYAGEMDRPGCVWTHTLLIDAADLGATELRALRRLFRRPNSRPGNSFAEMYQYSLDLNELPYEDEGLQINDYQIASFVMWTLYGTPRAPVFLPAESAKDFEDLIIAIWEQQWPSLRFGFRFCTGSIESRAINDQPLDLQVIPISSIRETRREVHGASIIATGLLTPPEKPEWLDVATIDLRHLQSSPLRDSFKDNVVPGFDGRGAYEALATLFSARILPIQGSELTAILNLLGERFPRSTDASSLKAAFTVRNAPLSKAVSPKTTDADILYALASTQSDSAFDFDSLSVPERCHLLWQEDRSGAESLISRIIVSDHHANAERILLSMLSQLPMQEALGLSKRIPGLIETLVGLDAAFATSPIVWTGSSTQQYQLFDAATRNREIPAGLQGEIVLAMLEVNSDCVAERAIGRFGPAAVLTVMDWFDAKDRVATKDLPRGWSRAISRYPEVLLDWLGSRKDPRESSAALVADLTDPHASQVRARGSELWLRTLRGIPSVLTTEAKTQFQAFLLALGFDNPVGPACELVSHSFSAVHNAASKDKLDRDHWKLFDDILPKLQWYRNWDKCERLRRGLVKSFVRFQWPLLAFFSCADDSDMLEQMLKSCYKADEGEVLFKRIKKALSDGTLQLSKEYATVLGPYM